MSAKGRSPHSGRGGGGLAEDALEAIVTDIETLPAVPDRHVSENGNVLLFEQCDSNIAVTYTATRGDDGRR